jgi:hypothetical protein
MSEITDMAIADARLREAISAMRAHENVWPYWKTARSA